MGQEWKSAVDMVPVYLIGDALEFCNSIAEERMDNLDDVFEKLRGRFCLESFKLIVSEKLYSEKQGEDEPIDEFISRFTKEAKIVQMEGDQLLAQFMSNLKSTLNEDILLHRHRQSLDQGDSPAAPGNRAADTNGEVVKGALKQC